MSMLAEPRKRQKISVNPNGNSWSSDSSKFGQKLLERMGWQQGKGLGLKESGDTSHVKVKLNRENRGLGCTKQEADNWIAHQDDFASLLTQLNEEHSAAGSETDQPSPVATAAVAKGLLAKSKSSRKRVHYEKFAKGKDVSRYGDKSLEQIFGRRSAPTLLPSRDGSSTDSSEPDSSRDGSEPNVDDGDGSGTASEGTVTNRHCTIDSNIVASSLSVTEYFAMKMAARKQLQASPAVIERQASKEKQLEEEEDDEQPTATAEVALDSIYCDGDSECHAATTYSGAGSGCERQDSVADGRQIKKRKKEKNKDKKKEKKKKKQKKRKRSAKEASSAEESQEEADH